MSMPQEEEALCSERRRDNQENETLLRAADLLAHFSDRLTPQERQAFTRLIASRITLCPEKQRFDIVNLFSKKPVDKEADALQLALLQSSDPLLYKPILTDSPYIHASHVLDLLQARHTDKLTLLASRPDLEQSTMAALIRLGERKILETLIDNAHLLWSNRLLDLLVLDVLPLVDPLYRLVSGPAQLALEQQGHAYWLGSKAVRCAIVERLKDDRVNRTLSLAPRDYAAPEAENAHRTIVSLIRDDNVSALAPVICRWLKLPESLSARLSKDHDGLNFIIALKALGVREDTMLLVLGSLWVQHADLDKRLETAYHYAQTLPGKVARLVIELWRHHERRFVNARLMDMKSNRTVRSDRG